MRDVGNGSRGIWQPGSSERAWHRGARRIGANYRPVAFKDHDRLESINRGGRIMDKAPIDRDPYVPVHAFDAFRHSHV